MKSIMEQASSIIKAIEKAWISADKPKEFSVKIFEQEEKNFFGMTTKPAKIGIFFSDKNGISHEKNIQKPRQQDRPEIKEQRPEGAKHHPRQTPPIPKQSPENKPARTEKPKVDVHQTKTN